MDDPSVNLLERAEEYGAGQVIFAEYDIAKYVYTIVKGEVGIFASKQNRARVFPLMILRVGELVGNYYIFDEGPCKYIAIATQETRLVKIKKNELLTVLKSGDPVAFELAQSICNHLQDTLHLLTENKIESEELKITIDLNPIKNVEYGHNVMDYDQKSGKAS